MKVLYNEDIQLISTKYKTLSPRQFCKFINDKYGIKTDPYNFINCNIEQVISSIKLLINSI